MAKSRSPKAAHLVHHPVNGHRARFTAADSEDRPAKKAKLLDESDAESSDEAGGGITLKVNEDYARRFEHNKKREEKQRLEEKYGKKVDASSDEEEEDSEEDESEDDDGELITEDLDAAINETLQAIRSRDPRVYDEKVTFYHDDDDDENAAENDAATKKKEKPMTLKDYHTKNLLEGKVVVDDDEDAPPKTYAQEQEEVRQTLLKEMHVDAGSDEEDDFLVAKSKPEKKNKKDRPLITEKDVEEADKDPETFLSNFMASRAWVPTDGAHWKPLESDDDEEDERAETFEAAYNMYFEDPAGTNEKIVTYARDAVAATSVRREEPNARKKAREAARAKREAEKREREQEMARLRKLRIEEMEEKVKRIRECAGLSGKDFKMEEWADVLDADWSDDQWDAEMRKRFGEDYYAGKDGDVGSEDEDEEGKKKRKKPKKPKWDDDIDIHDLVPDFEDEETAKPDITLSSDEEDGAKDAMDVDDEDEQSAGKKHKSSKQRKQERAEAKSAARRDRRLIERLVDSQLEADIALASKSSSKTRTQFRYRETSPTTFGLTARDILLADDTALNQFAGLKKLATFRDPAKKKKDKKALSKKARLRQWRAETFGNEDGPQGGFELLLGEEAELEVPQRKRKHADGPAEDGMDIREGEKKKKRRSRKKKDVAVVA